MTKNLFSFASTVKRMHDGPLGLYVDGFAAFLKDRGHPRSSARDKVRLVADLSRWLQRRPLLVAELREETIEQFLRGRKRRLHIRPGDKACLHLLLKYLRKTGVVTTDPSSVQDDALHPVEHDFSQYLVQERGLAQATLLNYLSDVHRFLSFRFGKGRIQLCKLRPVDVIQFVQSLSGTLSPKRVQLAGTALRSFFRFLRFSGKIGTDLAACVPRVPDRRLAALPKFLPPEQVERLLKCSRNDTATGRRDHAILLMLARLGLRAGDIVGLALEDIDWDKGEIRLRGKGTRQDSLPLPHDAGKALATYLREGRPECSTRRVFVRHYAPHKGFASSAAVCTIVKRALDRAGLNPPYKGCHVLRHSLATRMLRQGASLFEIGGILRHRHPDTTAIYAKVDLVALRTLAQVWPGGAK